MQVVISGATGFIGRHLAEQLADAGHTIAALTRDPARARVELPMVRDAFAWNPTAEPAPVAALQGADAVVHLAGEPVVGRWTAAKRAAIRDSRVLGTRNLVAAMAATAEPPRVFVAASAIGYYGDRGNEILTEESAPGSDFLAAVCQQWEAESLHAEDLGVRTVPLRIGIVLGPGGGALAAMLLPFRLGVGGPLGSGRQWWSWIHRDDLVGMIRFALENESLRGPCNATGPRPLPQKLFARTLGRVLHRPALLPAPAFALRTILGGFSAELLSSKRVRPARMTRAGYEFLHPELTDALRASLG